MFAHTRSQLKAGLFLFIAVLSAGCAEVGTLTDSLKDLTVNAAGFRIFNPGHVVEDVHHTVMTISGKSGSDTVDFVAIVGPFPEVAPGAMIKPDSLYYDPSATPARFGLNPTEPAIDLEEGYAYVCGTRPRIRTRRISTTSTGTTYLVQIDGPVERVFMIDPGAGAKVNVVRFATTDASGMPIPEATAELSDKDTYVEIAADHSVSGPLPLSSATPETREWVAKVTARAASAGIP